MMRRQTACALFCAMLAGATHPGVTDHPAGQLPTHYLVAPGDDAWSGRLHALQFRPPPDMPETFRPPAMWEAAKLLDAHLPDTRRLWTFRQGDTFDRTAVPLRWEALAPAQQDRLNGHDGHGIIRLGYLRGVRRHETAPPQLRRRMSVLGAVRGAHVQLLGPPGFMLDARHTEFRRQHAGRRWTVYIGANDGMLHAFDARTGSERFAVMPDAALPAVTRNIAPGQPAPAPVCRRPFATDAWTGAQWRSVLACTTGAMAPGLFLVDVTNPDAETPPPLLAYDTHDDPAVGHVEDPVPVLPLADESGGQSRWFALSGNGDSTPNVESRLLLLALDQPRSAPWQPGRTAFAITVPPVASRGGLGAPAVALGPNGRASFAYAGDRHGQVWRFDLRGAPPWPQALGRNHVERRQPFFIATSRAGLRQRIVGPILLAATAGGPLLVFTAMDAAGTATLYGVADAGNGQRKLAREHLAGRTACETNDGVTLHADDDRSVDAGWRIDLPAGHAPDDLVSAGPDSLLLITRDPDGHSRAYLLDPRSGLPVDGNVLSGRVLASEPLVTMYAGQPVPQADGSSTQVVQTRLWQAVGDRLQSMETHRQSRRLGRLSWREVFEEGMR
ncbi:pilus assembly protein [Ralstonia solanacearum]|uniref:Pilus assembly protein PilY n=1 Tax=Ralstonia solanacearum TaxID=305 RepID=A0AAD0S9S0_RALSL|nr:PilC/PilY family type IV pilus protein [Ralstonia solanacearum]AXV82374.1 pilus assembly protein PilY [Ralstonia solanacearum]AXW53498.1 pilus assembly protein PilY [Ralstonia solanacearum]